MGQTDIFKITHTEIVTDLNGLQEAGLPLVGSSYGAAESVVMSYAVKGESHVLSGIPEIYRQMTREIRGEIVVEMAMEGQTDFQLGMFPVTADTVFLYVDYGLSATELGQSAGHYSSLPAVNRVAPDSAGTYGTPGRTPYTFRTVYDRLPATQFEVDPTTGAGKFTGHPDLDPVNGYKLRAGARVFADYKHTGMDRCHNLRDIAIRLASTRFGMSLSGIDDAIKLELQNAERTAREQLYDIQNGLAGVDLLDQLKLVDETRQAYRIPRRGFSVFM